MNSPRIPKLPFNVRRRSQNRSDCAEVHRLGSLRQRCYSETRTRPVSKFPSIQVEEQIRTPAKPITIPNQSPSMSYSRRRTMHVPRMFTLDSSITKSKDQLARLYQELHTVNEDLNHVMKMKRQMSSDVQSNTSAMSSENSSSDDGDEDIMANGDMFDLCRTAQHDLRMADLARVELQSMLVEIEIAAKWEEKDMVSRAGWLRRESAQFEKLSPMAVEKLTGVKRRESHPQSASESKELPDLSSLCLSL